MCYGENGFEPGSSGEFWYIKAVNGYRTFEGDKGKFMTQAGLWLTDEDMASLEIAWNLVEMEHRSAEDLG